MPFLLAAINASQTDSVGLSRYVTRCITNPHQLQTTSIHREQRHTHENALSVVVLCSLILVMRAIIENRVAYWLSTTTELHHTHTHTHEKCTIQRQLNICTPSQEKHCCSRVLITKSNRFKAGWRIQNTCLPALIFRRLSGELRCVGKEPFSTQEG